MKAVAFLEEHAQIDGIYANPRQKLQPIIMQRCFSKKERNNKFMPIVNVMEEMVRNKLNERLEKTDCCKCEKCVDDMMAIALNRLPSKYVSTPRGELFSRVGSSLEKQNSLDIEFAVVSAIEFVSNHPRHDD